ncbi:hypothetical protein H8356DRAFT_1720014 [Neocallimastix lanati (nom. inval.)]|jgi:hypothetical protein|nr:hypothetical protein H8356DRAFT_1720014 [Neocallimastix sp. JGI-2020a]
MKLNLFNLFLSTFIVCGNAEVYNFSVISTLGVGKKIAVVYNNGETVEMKPTKFPLYEVSVDTPSISTYHYVELNQLNAVAGQETFERNIKDKKENEHDVYNRVKKEIIIPELPHPFDAQFPMGSEKLQPIPEDIIYNVYVECDNATYLSVRDQPFLTKNGGRQRNDVSITCPIINIITPKGEFSSSGTLRLVGYGSRLYKKLSWLLKLDKKFLGRKSIKLRGIANDPTLLRDKLSLSLLKAVGIPVQEGSFARVYINSDTWGLYSFIDTLNPKWMKGYIHGDDDYKIGSAYKLFSSHPDGPYASLEYLGDDYTLYKTYTIDIDEKTENDNVMDNEDVKANTEENFKPMLNFIKLFHNWKIKYQNELESVEAVKELETFLNIELTLRIIAIESFVMAVDNFTPYQSNIAIYYNPEQKKYHFLPYDYDEALKGYFTEYFPKDAINDCMNWYITSDYVNAENFVKVLLKYKPIRDRYLVILAKASRTTFSIESVSAYVDALANLIRDDVEWNFNLVDQYPSTYDGLINKYTIQHFEGNLNNEPVPFIENVIVNDNQYGLKQFVELRSNVCQDLTKDIKVTISKSYPSYTVKISKLLIISLFIIFFLL